MDQGKATGSQAAEKVTPASEIAEPKFGMISVGSTINSKTGEHYVAVCVNTQGARLSIEGARLVSKQITEWADFAEKKNEERKSLTLTYKIIQRAAASATELTGWTPVDSTETRKRVAKAERAAAAKAENASARRRAKKARNI